MRTRICAGALLLVLAACGGPATPTGYVDEYGGMESQYEVIAEATDCQQLGKTAADMNERYHRPSESRETKRIALGYQTAAVDRMVELDCP